MFEIDFDEDGPVIDGGLMSALFRVSTWLTEREMLRGLGDVVHEANGHVLRVKDLRRLVDKLETLPEVGGKAHE